MERDEIASALVEVAKSLMGSEKVAVQTTTTKNLYRKFIHEGDSPEEAAEKVLSITSGGMSDGLSSSGMQRAVAEIIRKYSASEKVAAANDLATILELIPAMDEKRAERIKKQEEYRQETNRMYAEEMKDIGERSSLLLDDLKKAIVEYFTKNGMGVRGVEGWGLDRFGGEIFIGSGDGEKRSNAKVVVHLSIGVGESLGHRDRDAYFFLRNDENTMEDEKFILPEKNTVKEVIKIITKFDKKGFWHPY